MSEVQKVLTTVMRSHASLGRAITFLAEEAAAKIATAKSDREAIEFATSVAVRAASLFHRLGEELGKHLEQAHAIAKDEHPDAHGRGV